MTTVSVNSLSVSNSRSISLPVGRDGIVLFLLLAMQLVFFTGVASSDDCGYVDMIRYMQRGEPVPEPMYYFLNRFMHWRLVQLAVFAFPTLPWAIALVPMAATCATLLIIRAFARRYVDPQMAWLAMLMFGLLPLVAVNASVALPEPVATALVWGGIYLAAGPLLERQMARPCWRLLLGGFLMGCGYNAKETVALLVPGMLLFVPLFRLRYRWAWWRGTILAVGALLWVLLETIGQWYVTGDPLFRSHVVLAAQKGYGVDRDYSGWNVLWYWSDYLRWLAEPMGAYGLCGLLLLAGVGFAFWKRSDRTRLLLCPCLFMLLYLSVGAVTFKPYQPFVHQPRYLYPVLPGFALLAGMMLWYFWQRGRAYRVTIIAMLLVLAGTSSLVANRYAGRWYNAATFNAGYRLMTEQVPALPDSPKVYAAPITWNRFYNLHDWAETEPVEKITTIPQTPEQWKSHYAGSCILISRFDYAGPSRTRHLDQTIKGPALESLRQFPRIARVEPPGNRLRQVQAWLLNRPVPTDPRWAVELYRIDPR